jgi:transposase
LRQWPPKQEIHIILDNLSANKTRLRDFLEAQPQVRLHFTPTYSSWLNQVGIWFAKTERDVIARGVFTSVPDLARKLRRYIDAYSAGAQPIRWKYSDVTHRIRSNDLAATCTWYGGVGFYRRIGMSENVNNKAPQTKIENFPMRIPLYSVDTRHSAICRIAGDRLPLGTR